jgi:hypothetical protein
MAAKVVRLVWNFATLKDGTPNPEFQPDSPTCAMQMLSVDSIPPEWSFDESQCVRFPSHEAAEVRVEELRALGIRCHAQTLPRDPNQRPAFESLPPSPIKQLLPVPVLAEPNRTEPASNDLVPADGGEARESTKSGQPNRDAKADRDSRGGQKSSKRRGRKGKAAELRAAHARVNGGDSSKKFWWREGQFA